MRLPAFVLPLLVASLASSKSFFGSDPQHALVDEDNLSVPGENPLDFCSDPKDYLITVHNVDLDPNPPKPGDTLKIKANGTVHQDIEAGATVFLQVKYGLITILKKEADLCDNLPKIDINCPLKKGPMTIEKEVDIPKQVPPGKYAVLADVNTTDKERITCMTSTVFFGAPKI